MRERKRVFHQKSKNPPTSLNLMDSHIIWIFYLNNYINIFHCQLCLSNETTRLNSTVNSISTFISFYLQCNVINIFVSIKWDIFKFLWLQQKSKTFHYENVKWFFPSKMWFGREKKNKKSEEEFFSEISIMTENYWGVDNLKRE